MQESVCEEIEFDRELFYKCFEVIKKKRNSKYDFLIKSGKSLKEALFFLFKHVWNTEEKPEQWRKTTIIQLQK